MQMKKKQRQRHDPITTTTTLRLISEDDYGDDDESLIGLWLLAWALAFGFGIDFCTVELRKYVDLGGFGFKWVRLKLKISQS